jgi:hypothetical protein
MLDRSLFECIIWIYSFFSLGFRGAFPHLILVSHLIFIKLAKYNKYLLSKTYPFDKNYY